MRWERAIVAGCLLASASGCSADKPPAPLVVAADSTYRHGIEQWRRARIDRLRAADGWLSYTGSGRLRPGRHRVGHAPHNEIVLPGGPAQLGILELDGGNRIWFEPENASGDGAARVELEVPPGQSRSRVLDVGTGQFHVVRLGNLFGWRFRDPAAPERREFRGIEYFPIDPSWRIVAAWHPFVPPRSVTLLTSIATPQPSIAPGEAVFERDGRSFRLQPVQYPDSDTLFFMITDRTSGRETYGGARYLRVEQPTNGHVVLDFNRAENPPCAFTAHVVCALAPPGNRLDLSVTAGEKSYVATR